MRTYVEKLNAIDNIRIILGNLTDIGFYEEINKELPVIIILGVQSAGKSSVIRRITNNQVKLPEKSTACTRVATEIKLRKCKQYQQVELHGPNNKIEIIENKDIRAAVSEAQEKALEGTSGDGFATNHTIVVNFHSPEQPNITFIDMPGFTSDENSKQILSLAEERVTKYPGTLVLHVAKGDQDYDGLLGNDFIRKTGKSTITVLTHLDKYTEDDQKLKETLGKTGPNTYAVIGSSQGSQEEEEQQLKQLSFLKSLDNIKLGSKELNLELEKQLGIHLEQQIPIASGILKKTYQETIERLELIQEEAPVDVLHRLLLDLKDKHLQSQLSLRTQFRVLIEEMSSEIRNYCIQPISGDKDNYQYQKIDLLDDNWNIGDLVLIYWENGDEALTEVTITSIEQCHSNILNTRFTVKLEDGKTQTVRASECFSYLCVEQECLLEEIKIELDKTRGLRNIIHGDRMPIIEQHANKFSEHYTQVLHEFSEKFLSLIRDSYTKILSDDTNEIYKIPLQKLQKTFLESLITQQQKITEVIERIKSYNQPPIVNSTNEHYLNQLIAKMMEGHDFSDDMGPCKHIYYNIRAFIKDQRKFICEIASKEFQLTLLIENETHFNKLLESSMSILLPLIKDPEKIVRERKILSNKKEVLKQALSEIKKIE